MAQAFAWNNGDRVLFLGDRVMDDPMGYPRLIAAMITAQYPDRAIDFDVRLVGGNRLPEVIGRLDGDLLAWHPGPTQLVVALGINDVWTGEPGTPIGRFRELYAELLQRLRDTGAHLLCLTPTVRSEEPGQREQREMRNYVDAITEIAFQHSADVIDVHQALTESIAVAQAANPTFRYTIDGERLNVYGHLLVAMAVLQALNFNLRRERPEQQERQAA